MLDETMLDRLPRPLARSASSAALLTCALALTAAACDSSTDFPTFDVLLDGTETGTETGVDATDDVDPTDSGDIGDADAGTDATDTDAADTDAGDVATDATDTDAGDVATDADADVDLTGIGPEGGTVTFGPVTLTVPPGALSERTEIVISTDTAAEPEGFVFDSDIFRFEPEGLEFAVPFEVCFRLDGVRPANMTLFWTTEDGDFEPVPARDAPSQVCGTTDHFSRGFIGGYDDDDCLGLDCPAQTGGCDGDIASTPALAVCIAGECIPTGATIDCAESGLECVAGACAAPPECGNGVREVGEECDGTELGGVTCEDYDWGGGTLGCDDACRHDLAECTGDPCESVVCDDAPPSVCLGNEVVSFGGGTCAFGECSYAETRVDCAESGSVCVAAECIVGPTPGDLVITEYMANVFGNDDGKEWFEVLNTTDHPVAIRGLTVTDDGIDAFVVDTGVVIPAGVYFVFGASDSAAPTVDFDWSEVARNTQLANGDDEIVLTFRGTEIDRVNYDDGGDAAWPDPEGASVSLAPDATDNATPDAWCTTRGTAYFPSGDRGTPGEANPVCDGVCGDGFLDDDEECDDGNTVSEDGCSDLCTFEIDPCDAVTCDAPPAPECDEDIAIAYSEVGECVAGVCSYASEETDCTETDEVCIDGACVDVRPGDLIITEFLANPDGDDDGLEWFEVLNPTATPVSLDGIVISDLGTEAVVIETELVVDPGEYFVFGESLDAAPLNVDLVWSDFGTFTLSNGDDEIVLTRLGVEFDRVTYDDARGWPMLSGVANTLSSTRLDPDENDSPSHWCVGLTTYGVGENLGTPGVENPSCGECGDGEVGADETCDDGNVDPGDGCSATCEIEECATSDECLDAPSGACDGEFAVTYEGGGACVLGECVFAEVSRTDCSATLERCSAGVCVSGAFVAGDIVITEYLANPDGVDDGKEWFEVLNVSSTPISLTGLRVTDDDTDSFTVDRSLTIDAGQRMVFAETLEAVPGAVDFAWDPVGSFTLANGDDEIVLTLDDVVLDRITYDDGGAEPWPDPNGSSVTLSEDALDAVSNDDPANWCIGVDDYDGSNNGTPGEANRVCE